MSFTAYALKIGPFNLTYFGVIVVLAVAAAAVVTAFRLARQPGSPESAVLMVYEMALSGLIGAVLMGRLFFILNPPPSVNRFYDRHWYLTHPFDMVIGPLALWNGGLGRAGVVVGALLGVGWILWRRRADLAAWADALTPALIVLLTALPWANGVNEQLFGPPTTLPWGVHLARRIAPFDDLARYPADTRFHPTPAYVSLWALASGLIVYYASRRWRAALRPGDQLLLTLAVYLPGLFLADFLRVDVAIMYLSLTGLQWLAGLLWLGAVGVLVVRHRGQAAAAVGADS